MTSDPVRSLAADLDALIALLEHVDEQHWAGWFRAARAEIMNRDAHGLTRILRAYGGMGSFNDLLIHPQNGHTVRSAEVGQASEQLDALRVRIRDTAELLRKQSQ